MSMTSAERQAAYRARNPERSKEQWRKYANTTKGTAQLLFNYAKDRARRQNLAFDLDKEFVLTKLENGKCELTDLPFLKQSPGSYRTHPMTPSLDRIKPELGYVKSNVRMICFGVNRALSDWGDEMLLTFAKALVNKQSITK